MGILRRFGRFIGIQTPLLALAVIVMAHRLSTMELADRVLVLEDGGTAGTGHPGELMRTNPAYRCLLADQSTEQS